MPRVVIDHHASNQVAGDADWVDPNAAATCEMVTLLAARLGVPLDVDGGAMATALMGGIVMDTATFAHPNATPRTLAVSAALVEAGAPLSDISRRLYRTKPDAQLRLFGLVLDRMRERGRRSHRLVDAARRRPGRDRDPAAALGGDHRPARPGRGRRGRHPVQGGRPRRRGSACGRKPGGVDATVLTGAFGGEGTPGRPAPRSRRPVADAGRAVLAEARRLAAAVRR